MQENNIIDIRNEDGKLVGRFCFETATLTITNPAAKTDRELVVFRDSFASSLTPLLAGAYAKITLVDIRYLQPERLGTWLTFDTQDVLFLYSAPVLNSSETIR